MPKSRAPGKAAKAAKATKPAKAAKPSTARRSAKGASPPAAARKPSHPQRSSKPAKRAPAPTGKPEASPAEGDAAVRAYIATLPAWQRDIAQRLDAVMEKEVAGLRRTIKWHAPVYGTEDNGWFASLGAFAKHLKVVFFQGAKLKPALPGGSGKQMRSLDIRQGDAVDEARIAGWVRQASKIRGMGA